MATTTITRPGMTTGSKVIYGVPPELKPLRGVPDGRVRYRFRNDAFAKAFVRTSTGIFHFIILDKGDHWEGLLQGRNENR